MADSAATVRESVVRRRTWVARAVGGAVVSDVRSVDTVPKR